MSGRMTPAAAASSSTSSKSVTIGAKARAAASGWEVSSCWANSASAGAGLPLEAFPFAGGWHRR
jgi:hypothetical protein